MAVLKELLSESCISLIAWCRKKNLDEKDYVLLKKVVSGGFDSNNKKTKTYRLKKMLEKDLLKINKVA